MKGVCQKKGLYFYAGLLMQLSFEVRRGYMPSSPPYPPLMKKREFYWCYFLALDFPLAPLWKFFCRRRPWLQLRHCWHDKLFVTCIALVLYLSVPTRKTFALYFDRILTRSIYKFFGLLFWLLFQLIFCFFEATKQWQLS